MKRIPIFIFSLFILSTSFSADKILLSGVYDWQNLLPVRTRSGFVREIIKNPTRSLEMFEIKAVTLKAGKSLKGYTVAPDFDELVIIKEGSVMITINGESKTLEQGSIAVAPQGSKVIIKNPMKNEITFYSFRLKPRPVAAPKAPFRITGEKPALFREWNSIEFKPSANGGRRDLLKEPTSSLKELEIHTTALKAGLPSHAAHTHPDEEIILVRFGTVEETINGKPFRLGPGSVIFLTNDDSHGIRNAGEGQCEYYAIRWLIHSLDTQLR